MIFYQFNSLIDHGDHHQHSRDHHHDHCRQIVSTVGKNLWSYSQLAAQMKEVSGRRQLVDNDQDDDAGGGDRGGGDRDAGGGDRVDGELNFLQEFR